MKENPKSLADLRRLAGKSQAQVAVSMGVGATQVGRIEARYPDVMFPVLRRYMDAIGVEIKFIGAGVVLPSDDIEADPSKRHYAQSIRTDPTRGFGQKAKEA